MFVTPGILPPVHSIADRLTWVLERTSESERALSMKAGLSPGTMHAIRKRLTVDPNDGVELTSLNAIADAAGVSRVWLSHGRGRPDDPNEGAHPDQSDRYPNRA